MPGIRRDYLAYGVVLLCGIAAAAAIHLNQQAGLKSAQARFRAESHAATLAAQNIAQTQLGDIYQSLRTISRLPSVRDVDRHANNIDPDSLAALQELYNNLSSNVDVSEIYVVPSSLDADQIDPVTKAPQTPILMFDGDITGDANATNVTKNFETEIYEYHLLHQQMQWFETHTPDIKSIKGVELPIIAGHPVITCDNTVYNISHNNADRTGIIFTVPFFGTAGHFKGGVSAIIRIKALRALLPSQNFALVNPAYGLLMISPHGGIAPVDLSLAAKGKADSALIYSETLPLDINDPDHGWRLWVAIPNQVFFARPDVRAVHVFATGAYAVLAILLLVIAAIIRMIVTNDRLIARATRALNALASGDETVTLNINSKSNAINELAGAFSKFRQSLAEKRALEERAAADTRIAEAERARFDAERAEAALEQKNVVDALAAALISFTNGDLTFKIRDAFTAEYKTLQTDFNHASAKMAATMRQVTTSTITVETGARDIQKATAEIARRTEAQAAQLEQTAAALNEITETVRQTSQNAGNAAALATTARTDADASSDVVRDTLNAMTGIENSSKQIANIIGVIDEIAFQTNLLALNAGVEAARAGDAGRGFAVVATEVRALAQRSANAAKEIKIIISAAGTQVGGGVRLVNETGQALLRITGQIAQLNDLVRDISDAARQQAASLQQLNQSVGQMDQATQQNARMVEQAAAAGTSLTNEASSLGQLVSDFKISEAEPSRSHTAQHLTRPKLVAIS